MTPGELTSATTAKTSPEINIESVEDTKQRNSGEQPTTPTNKITISSSVKLIAGSLGNMSVAESMDGSFYGGFEAQKNIAPEADNIPVDARPKTAG